MEIGSAFIQAQQTDIGSLNRLSNMGSRLEDAEPSSELREKFQQFVAGTFFQTLLKSMRETVDEGTLMHGGKAEEIFRAQLDQTITEELAASRGSSIADSMFAQFQLMMNPASTWIDEREVQSLDGYRTTNTALGAFTDNVG